jgi:hypothetical protein
MLSVLTAAEQNLSPLENLNRTNCFYVYYTCLAIIGATLGLSAVFTVVDGSTSLPIILRSLGGLLMTVASVYELLSGSPSEFDVGKIGYWAVVLGTVGVLLSLIIGFV